MNKESSGRGAGKLAGLTGMELYLFLPCLLLSCLVRFPSSSSSLFSPSTSQRIWGLVCSSVGGCRGDGNRAPCIAFPAPIPVSVLRLTGTLSTWQYFSPLALTESHRVSLALALAHSLLTQCAFLYSPNKTLALRSPLCDACPSHLFVCSAKP